MERNLTHRFGAATAILAFVLAVVALLAGPASAQSRIVTLSDESKHAGEFIVPINKSQILQLDVPFADLLVGNAEIADVLALTDRSIYVLGKALGSTSLTIYGRNRSLIAVLDLVVSHDIDGLKARLFELMPEESIEVRPLNLSIVLSGKVSSATRMKRALTIAEQFAARTRSCTGLGLKGPMWMPMWRGWSMGKTPLASGVVTTGALSCSASRKKSPSAPARKSSTPPISTGFFAERIRSVVSTTASSSLR